jgi:hypothetical protein
MEHSIGTNTTLQVKPEKDHLFVRVQGAIDGLEQLEELHAHISKAAADNNSLSALVDHREFELGDDLIKVALAYLQVDGPFTRVALIVRHIEIRRAFDPRNEFDRVELQTFERQDVAKSWLAESESWPAVSLAVFTFGERRFAVFSERVEEIINYRKPAPIPSAPKTLAGLLAHRQNMVPIVRSPLPDDEELKDIPTRILITSSDDDFIGIPAGKTDYIGPVRVATTPTHGELCVTNLGELNILEPAAMLAVLSSKF